MNLKTLQSISLAGKTILYRAPYDIDVKEVEGVMEVVDDMRIKATITTLQYLLKENCKIVILTYVGRPDGIVVEKLRTTPHAKKLCIGKDFIVFDGFPQAHRMHASTTGILRHLPAVAGFYLEREVTMLSNLLDNPERPFTVIIGGAKISDKVDAIN